MAFFDTNGSARLVSADFAGTASTSLVDAARWARDILNLRGVVTIEDVGCLKREDNTTCTQGGKQGSSHEERLLNYLAHIRDIRARAVVYTANDHSDR